MKHETETTVPIKQENPLDTIEWEEADRVLTCIFECRTVLLSFVSYESHGKATSDIGG